MFATVGRSYDPTEAMILCSLLESAGFEASLADLHLVTANWPLAVALGGVRIQVDGETPEEIAAARSLLDDYYQGRLIVGEDEPDNLPVFHCPACGGDGQTARVPAGQKAMALFMYLFGVVVRTRYSRVCTQCRHAWPAPG